MTIERKFFGTDGIRGRVGVYPITPEFALKLGWAAGRILSQDGRGLVLIGKDTRLSGTMLSAALEAGFSAAGLDVKLLGAIPTPAVAYLTKTLNADLGVVVSASHNPFYDNGIKFFSRTGNKLPDRIELKIEESLDKTLDASNDILAELVGSSVYLNDGLIRYAEFCKTVFPKDLDLKGIKIVVDSANGSSFQAAPQVFSELGAEVISINDKPDGYNINADCGATSPNNLKQAVLNTQAEIGIALDGDGDRVILVDHLGNILDGDDILWVLAKNMLATSKQSGVVGTLMTNLGLEQALNNLNIPFVRSKVGDRYVLEELAKNKWLLGGEASGHIISLDHTTTGDGIVAALLVLAAIVRQQTTLHELTKDLTKATQLLKNIRSNEPKLLLEKPAVIKAIKAAESKLAKNGRLLVRPSGTEPLLRIMVEANSSELANSVMDELFSVCASGSGPSQASANLQV